MEDTEAEAVQSAAEIIANMEEYRAQRAAVSPSFPYTLLIRVEGVQPAPISQGAGVMLGPPRESFVRLQCTLTLPHMHATWVKRGSDPLGFRLHRPVLLCAGHASCRTERSMVYGPSLGSCPWPSSVVATGRASMAGSRGRVQGTSSLEPASTQAHTLPRTHAHRHRVSGSRQGPDEAEGH